MSTLHIFDRPRQPAIRWLDYVNVPMTKRGVVVTWSRRRFVHTNKPGTLLPTFCCRRRRPARNLDVKAFYDGVYVYCRSGKGCAVPTRRSKDRRVLRREFMRGLSALGLARKHGMLLKKVEAALRKALR